jgi:hypothetical protein
MKWDENPISHLDPCHSRPNCNDVANTFVADHRGKCGMHRVDPLGEHQVVRVERGKIYLNENLIPTRLLRLREFDLL